MQMLVSKVELLAPAKHCHAERTLGFGVVKEGEIPAKLIRIICAIHPGMENG